MRVRARVLPLFLAALSVILVRREVVRSRVLLESMQGLPGETVMEQEQAVDSNERPTNQVIADKPAQAWFL